MDGLVTAAALPTIVTTSSLAVARVSHTVAAATLLLAAATFLLAFAAAAAEGAAAFKPAPTWAGPPMALERSFLPSTQAILLLFPLTSVRFGPALTPPC